MPGSKKKVFWLQFNEHTQQIHSQCIIFLLRTEHSVLCISTSFWVRAAPKGWLNYFFSTVFNLFLHFKPFSVISCLKSTKKHVKMTEFFSYFAYSSKLADMQKLVDSLRGYPEIVLYSICFLIAKVLMFD